MAHFKIAKEEMAVYGAENSSLQNLLALIIGPKADAETTGALASMGINNLVEMTLEELTSFKGVGESTAQRILSSFALANQIRRYKRVDRFKIKSPASVFEYFEDLRYLNQEYFEAIYLDTKSHVILRKNIFKGSLNFSLVHPREIFKEAVKVSAASVIVVHNHPSGDPFPSNQDLEVTARLVESGKLIGIDLIDHVIIGEDRFYSLKESKQI